MNPIVEKLNKYIEEKLLRKCTDPKTGLTIYDYTEHCTYEGKWDEITTMHRSTIRDRDGDLVVQGMPKFFNFFQLSPEKQKEVAKWDFSKCRITQKYDGCLATIFPYAGHLIITSKCTFDNYVVKATEEIIKDKIYINDLEDTSLGLIVEVIHPNTKQVVDYKGLKEIRVIAGINMATGQEYEYEWTKEILNTMGTGVEMVEQKPFTFERLQKWTKEHDYSEEGFVVQNLETGERVKFKSEDYLKVAAIKANMNMRHLLNDTFANIDNWREHLYEIIKGLPDESQPEAKDLIKVIENTYKKYEHEIVEAADKVKDLSDKELGMLKDSEIIKLKPCIFNLRKGSSNDRVILNKVRDEILSMEEYQ